jgi:hypothetical protein
MTTLSGKVVAAALVPASTVTDQCGDQAGVTCADFGEV